MDPDSGFVTVFKIVFVHYAAFILSLQKNVILESLEKQRWRLIGGLQQADTIYAIKTRKADGSK